MQKTKCCFSIRQCVEASLLRRKVTPNNLTEGASFNSPDYRIGERNIYAHGEIFQRNEGSFFSYKMEGQRLATVWAVYYRTGIEKKMVLTRNSFFTSEEDIRNEVEIANRYLSN